MHSAALGFQIGSNSETEPLDWHFASSFGPWGRLLSSFYDITRQELPNERQFWKDLVTPGISLLEIGAGTGFISEALAKTSARQLTLVEPEVENIKLLQRKISLWDSSIDVQVVQSNFESARVSPHDLIIFPFDSLPMIKDSTERAQLFKIVSTRLTATGMFAVHISTPRWAKGYIESTKDLSIKTYCASSGEQLEARRLSKSVSTSEYIKFISVNSHSQSEQENYVAATAIIYEDEIFRCANNAGLKLVHRYNDFFGNTSSNADDDIFIFCKEHRA